MNRKLLLILNPTAGKQTAKPRLLEIIQIFSDAGYTVTVCPTTHRAHAYDLAKDAGNQYDLIVCCGGDGTLNEVVSGLISSKNDVTLGYIPAGSTNDLAASLKLPKSLIRAARLITERPAKNHDVGIFCGNTVFTYIASFGAFTDTSYNTPQSMKNSLGHLAYLLEGSKTLTKLKNYNLKITYDEGEIEGDFLFGAVSNSTSMGGVLRLDNPSIDFNDGLFEVILIKKPENIVDLTATLNRLMTKNFDDKHIMLFSTSKVTFSGDVPKDWSLDGEYKSASDTVTVENMKSGIRLIY